MGDKGTRCVEGEKEGIIEGLVKIEVGIEG